MTSGVSASSALPGALGRVPRPPGELLPVAIMLSLVLHAAALAVLPGWAGSQMQLERRVRVRLLAPEHVPLAPVPLAPIAPADSSPPAAAPADPPPAAAGERDSLLGALLPPPPFLDLSPTTQSPDAPQATRLPRPVYSAADPQHVLQDWQPHDPAAGLEDGAAELLGAPSAGLVAQQTAPALDLDALLAEVAPAEEQGFEIRGPAAERRVLSKPPPPRVEIPEEVVIELRFWVQADGSVARVVPEVKGNAFLEKVAIEYLSRWRFTPLAAGAAAEQQWGVIAIKFRKQ